MLIGKAKVGKSLSADEFYCGRSFKGFKGTILANSYTVEKYGRGVAIQMFRRWLWEMIKAGSQEVLEALKEASKSKTLLCWCWEGEDTGVEELHCHAQVIARAINYCKKEKLI